MNDPNSNSFVNEWNSGEDKISISDSSILAYHTYEKIIASRILTHPSIKIDQLVVRRLKDNSICLEGNLLSNDDDIDITEFLKQKMGIKKIVNRLNDRQNSCGEDTVTLNLNETQSMPINPAVPQSGH